MADALDYRELTKDELESLEREKTVFFMVLSPLEAHGPHLPLGTDLILGEEIKEMMVEILQEDYPEYVPVNLPDLTLGSDALPRAGSIDVGAPVLFKVLNSYGEKLAGLGFKYLFLADNHGGPRHLLACERAGKKLYKRFGFYLINPFAREFDLMMKGEEEFLEESGLKPGRCGDMTDLHAGTNETSLLLAKSGEWVRANYRELPAAAPPEPGRIFSLAAGFFGFLGQKELACQIRNLGRTASWAADGNLPAYIGAPNRASSEAGEAMFAARRKVTRKIMHSALKGEKVDLRPPLWSLRFLSRFP